MKETELEVMIQIRNLLLLQQDFWSIDSFCTITGYQKSYVYKLTSQKKIRHYKSDGGKSITFKKDEAIAFMTKIVVKTKEELRKEAEQIIKSRK